MRRLMLFLLALLSPAAALAGGATPLFSSNDPISISLAGDWRDIAGSELEDPPRHGTLTIGDETHDVLLTTRGISRREKVVCNFPPLKIEFAAKPADASIFHKQKSLKLVTYCRSPRSFQQYVLKEYAAYRLYNEMTEQSFRVRLANVSYVDAKSGKTSIVRVGFFIEDVDDVADRNGMKEVDRGRTPVESFKAAEAAREAVFEYMIGNLDWEMTVGPPGENCCHNGRIIGAEKTASSDLIPVPYDFDVSGFVNPPYALPPDKLGVRSVTQRLYRGYCSFNDEARAAAAAFRAKRAALEGVLASTPGMSEKTIADAKKFLGGFFDAVADDAAVDKNLLSKCRG